MAIAKFQVGFEVYERGRKAPQYTVESDLKGEVSLAEFLHFTKSSLIVIADQVLREEQAKGFDKNPIVSVDGRVGKPVDRVHPLGKIEFNSKQSIKDIALFTMQGIIERSPTDTGLYKKSHRVLLNGTQVATDMASLSAWLDTDPQIKDSDLLRFVNIQPYARRLERLGVTAGNGKFNSRSARYEKSRDDRQRSGAKVLAPNGAYFLTSRAVRRKYKRNSSIKFGFLPGSAMGLGATFKNFSRASGSRKGSRAKPSTYLYPTITILVNEGGIL